MPDKILIPLDGSPESESALDYARMLAPKLDASLELLRCFEPPAVVYGLPELGNLGQEVLADFRLQQLVLEYLEAKLKELGDLPSEARSECGDPASTIIARGKQADMILMARQGRGMTGRWMMGGVAGKVIRSSDTPMLVVPGPFAQPPKLETIMVCLDGSEIAERVLKKALELAARVDAKLILYRFVFMVYDAVVMELELEEAKRYLQDKERMHPDLVKGTVVRRSGGRSDIVEYATELQADLIVLGSHGNRGLVRWLLGSVAEDTVHHAQVPVLVIR
jgi:nucleotide-binding universal stress UspA family protein